jgi:glyoxylase-like metal-dependent hydrolase (beta-lactamase superfamily II)
LPVAELHFGYMLKSLMVMQRIVYQDIWRGVDPPMRRVVVRNRRHASGRLVLRPDDVLTPSMASRSAIRSSARLFALGLVLLLQACGVTTHPVESANLGQPSSLAAMEAVMDRPGPIEVDSVVSADWQVPLSGLLNLDAPAARQAGLQDRDEPIEVYAHVLRHPTQGTFLVDTGVSRKLLDDPDSFGVHSVMRRFFPLDRMQLRRSTQEIVSHLPGKLRGVLLTHLHIDHISGMPDIASDVPLYVGKGEATTRALKNMFVQGTTDALLAGKPALREWPLVDAGDEPLHSVVDVFGDGTLYAFDIPGHTPGSTGYLARTPTGPVIFVGDTCPTHWGWLHGVEPGSFTDDHSLNRRSLLALKSLAERHPGLRVRLGHQAFGD